MKTCSYCGKQYPDDAEFCAIDLQPLKGLAESSPVRVCHAMKKSAKITIIVLVLLLELVWAAWPRLYMHGPVFDESYRHDERFATWAASKQHPSPETKAAFDREVALLDRHMNERALSVLAGVLAIDAIGIYFLWRYAPKKTTA